MSNVDYDIGPCENNIACEFEINSKFKVMINEFLDRTPKIEPNVKHEMTIKLSNDKTIYMKPQKLSIRDREDVNKIIKDLLDKNVIRHSNSDYASRIVLVSKKNGSRRLSVDYRELNKCIVKDRFPLPLIDDNLDKLQGMKIFSLIDLKESFHHNQLTTILYVSRVSLHPWSIRISQNTFWSL